ncbi:MAG: ATP-binding protein [Spirochaetaceae bacterium]|nr:MAG: ATP-binding protein [Spirochaetaceae bacterium]
MIARRIEGPIRKDAAGFPVVALLGPRQSGKTTLVKRLFPGMEYRNLEVPATREYAQRDPVAFLASGPNGMIVDEFQRVPELLSYIQNEVDARDEPGRYILTGSQNFLMMERISQSLAGRVGLFTLLPLSIGELDDTGIELPSLDETLFRGFFPRLFGAPIDSRRFYDSYVQTYLERDVRTVRDIGDLSRFQRFIRICAGRVGQIVNLSSISDDLGVSHNTVGAWLSVLEASYVIRLIRPYHRNFGKQTVKSPRLYFTDTGLVCSLLEIDSPAALETHYLRGAVFENLVATELAKAQLNAGRRDVTCFWRDRRGHEVDFLIDRGSTRFALEAKAGQTITSDWFRGLVYYGDLDEGCPPDHRFVVHGGTERQSRSAGSAVPWQEISGLARRFVG